MKNLLGAIFAVGITVALPGALIWLIFGWSWGTYWSLYSLGVIIILLNKKE